MEGLDRARVVGAGIVAIVSALLASVSVLVWLLLGAQVLDIASGLIAAGINGQISSDVGWKGIGRKVMTWIVVAVAFLAQVAVENQVLQITGTTIQAPIAPVVCGAYIGMELVSVLENAGRAGVWIPPVLRQALTKVSMDENVAKDQPWPPRS